MCQTPEEQKWRQEAVRKYKKYFELARSFVTCAENLEDEFARKGIPRETLGLDGLAISFLLAKSHKTTLAALQMCERGYPEDALLLARANLEAALRARYIAHDRENAAEKADALFKFDEIKRSNRLRELIRDYEEGDAFRTELDKALSDIKDKLPKTKEDLDRVRRLGNKTVLQLAKESSLTKLLYYSFYGQSSEYAHSSGRSPNSYVSDKDGHTSILIVPTDEGLQDLIIHLCLFLWYLMDRFNFLFDLGAEDTLKEKWRELDDICRRDGSEIHDPPPGPRPMGDSSCSRFVE